MQITTNGVTLEYETYGDPAHPPLLLIMGMAGLLLLDGTSSWLNPTAIGHRIARWGGMAWRYPRTYQSPASTISRLRDSPRRR